MLRARPHFHCDAHLAPAADTLPSSYCRRCQWLLTSLLVSTCNRCHLIKSHRRASSPHCRPPICFPRLPFSHLRDKPRERATRSTSAAPHCACVERIGRAGNTSSNATHVQTLRGTGRACRVTAGALTHEGTTPNSFKHANCTVVCGV